MAKIKNKQNQSTATSYETRPEEAGPSKRKKVNCKEPEERRWTPKAVPEMHGQKFMKLPSSLLSTNVQMKVVLARSCFSVLDSKDRPKVKLVQMIKAKGDYATFISDGSELRSKKASLRCQGFSSTGQKCKCIGQFYRSGKSNEIWTYVQGFAVRTQLLTYRMASSTIIATFAVLATHVSIPHKQAVA